MTMRHGMPSAATSHIRACVQLDVGICRGNFLGKVSPASCSIWQSSRRQGLASQRLICRASPAEQARENPLVKAGVSGLTGLLSVLGIGRRRQDAPEPVRRLDRVQPGDVRGIMDRIRIDYEEHAYFVTGTSAFVLSVGDIYEGIYAQDCFFGDPTVSFTGLQKWRRNLQLLVPFSTEPRIDLFSLSELSNPGTDNSAGRRLKADWRLTTYLKLPWKPFIDVNGSTDYTLNPSNQQVVRHIETWSVSGTEAILQILRPSREKQAINRGT